MATIIGLDLGKFKSLACTYDSQTLEARYDTIHTDPAELRKSLEARRPDLVVFETCTVAGWVADTCDELKLPYLVANPMHEAWSWQRHGVLPEAPAGWRGRERRPVAWTGRTNHHENI